MTKKPVLEDRVRRVPSQFSWVDHRLVRHQYLQRASAQSWGLYLTLVSVGDEHGLSYYSDRSLMRMLGLTEETLAACRTQLIRAGVVAYAAPIYQVLSLEQGGGL